MDSDELNDLTLILFGICTWDFVTSLWFEYRLLTKKILFRWQFVPYFLARYFVLAYAILNATSTFIDINAGPLCYNAAFINSVLFIGVLTTVFSTWNLLTRTIIIWGHHPVVTKLLFAIGFLHFVLSLIVASIKRPSCVPSPPSAVAVTIFGTTTTIIELAILVLSLVGIRRASVGRESHLARLLKSQGIAYFVMVFLLHISLIITSVCIDGFASLCVGIFGSILAPILSCRLVISTLAQNSHIDCNPEARTHRIERIELSEDQGQNTSGRMTTFIDIPKDQIQSVC